MADIVVSESASQLTWAEPSEQGVIYTIILTQQPVNLAKWCQFVIAENSVLTMVILVENLPVLWLRS